VIYLGAIAIAIMAGIAAGGNLKGVAKLKFRKGWIFFIAFFSQVLLQILPSNHLHTKPYIHYIP
jgi:hypothetical protein